MSVERCPDCGALYALVGRVHRCSGVKLVKPVVANHVANRDVANRDVANTQSPRVHGLGGTAGPATVDLSGRPSGSNPRLGPTYRYRDPEKRRTYMRDWMRQKRKQVTP